jgi:outer membrane translocation and assembly module TamA
MLTAAAACCCLIVVALVMVARHRANPSHSVPEVAAVQETVDLWNAGTLRSDQPSPLQSVSLPAALVKVTIILPRYSEPGRYVVAVTRDQTGNDPLAQSSTVATGNGDRQEVSVNLDLRKSRPGSYFLSTTHEQDQASYYYPLQIK